MALCLRRVATNSLSPRKKRGTHKKRTRDRIVPEVDIDNHFRRWRGGSGNKTFNLKLKWGCRGRETRPPRRRIERGRNRGPRAAGHFTTPIGTWENDDEARNARPPNGKGFFKRPKIFAVGPDARTDADTRSLHVGVSLSARPPAVPKSGIKSAVKPSHETWGKFHVFRVKPRPTLRHSEVRRAGPGGLRRKICNPFRIFTPPPPRSRDSLRSLRNLKRGWTRGPIAKLPAYFHCCVKKKSETS